MLHVNVAGEKGLFRNFRWEWEMRRRVKVRYLLFGRKHFRPRQGNHITLNPAGVGSQALTSIIIRALDRVGGNRPPLPPLAHVCLSLKRVFSLTKRGLTSKVLINRISIETFESSGPPNSGAKAQNQTVGDGGRCRGAVLVSLGVPSIGCVCRFCEGIERNAVLQVGDGANFFQAGRLRGGRLSRRPTCQQLSRNAAASSVMTGTFQARPSSKQTAVEFQALESFCARVRLPCSQPLKAMRSTRGRASPTHPHHDQKEGKGSRPVPV